MKRPATKDDKQIMEPLGTRCLLSQMQITLNQLGPVLPLKIFAANQMKRRKDAVPDTAEEAACLAERRGMLSKRSYPGLKTKGLDTAGYNLFLDLFPNKNPNTSQYLKGTKKPRPQPTQPGT